MNNEKRNKAIQYQFKAKLWKYRGESAWYFLTLPLKLTKTIRKLHFVSEKNWGRLPTLATIGSNKWKTAIWYDSKHRSYLLPVKASIRKKEKIAEGHLIIVLLEFEEDRLFNDLLIKELKS